MKGNTIKFKDLSSNVVELLGGTTCFMSHTSLDLHAPLNVHFNTLLYMKTDKQLIAIKILMASYFTSSPKFNEDMFTKCFNEKGVFISGWYYLIQTPYGTEWVSISPTTCFFHSKEEYYAHLKDGFGGFKIKTTYFHNLFQQSKWGLYGFYESWKWNGHCAEKSKSLIKNIIFTEDGATIVLSHHKDEYWTQEECTKANIEGLEIVEFPQTENSIKVTIEVVKTPPIVRTISFIEQ